MKNEGNIVVRRDVAGAATLSFTDTAGRAVLTMETTGIEEQVDISTLAPGLYYLKVVSD